MLAASPPSRLAWMERDSVRPGQDVVSLVPGDVICVGPHDTVLMDPGWCLSRILGLSIETAQAPAIAASAYLKLEGRTVLLPSNNLWGCKEYMPNSRLALFLDVLLILHAEHE